MVLIVSDAHLGEGPADTAQREELALVRCLKAHQARVTHVYLLGDLFDCFIEYRHVVPRGFVRLQGLLATWADRGVRITYLAGNHDPWHRTYVRDEWGARFVYDSIVATHFGHRLYLRHGDGLSTSAQPYRRIKPLLRHPVPTALYRSLLPADLGIGLARWVSHQYGGKRPSLRAAGEVRALAHAILKRTSIDMVAMGHTHIADLQSWPDGHYVNTGCWRDDRTFARIDATGLYLSRWNGWAAEEVDAVLF